MAPRSLLILRDRAMTARHKAYVHLLGTLAPYYVVNEFPKSGGTWLTLMLADALALPFRRNEPIRFEKSLVHGHFLNPGALRHIVVMWRDPRDLLVSLYHHCYFVSEFAEVLYGNKKIVDAMREALPFDDYEDVRANLPAFIRFASTTPIAPRFSWPAFADKWAGRPGTVQTSYERLRADTVGELVSVCKALAGIDLPSARAEQIAESRSFARAKAAAEQALPAGAQKSFIREGAVGGWRNQFSDEALQALDDCNYRGAMRALGYVD
jgi:Sulfotransferase domain